MAENFTKEFFEENRILKAIIHYAKRPSEGDLQELKKNPPENIQCHRCGIGGTPER